MSVYIDPLREVKKTRKWPWCYQSHMTADTLEELHEFAKRLGLDPAWYQDRHYDLNMAKAMTAERLGAVVVTTREIAVLRRSIK